MPQIRELHWKLCQLAFHIKNSVFYHLPTRGRAGIKLGDADTSSSYLNCLIVPCQYYTTFIYFLATFYTIFGTNILIQCPVPVHVCCMFYVSQNIHIKRNPNGTKTGGAYFWNICDFWEEKSTRDDVRGGHEAGGRALDPSGHPGHCFALILPLENPKYSKIILHKFLSRLDSIWYWVSAKHKTCNR